MARKSKDKHDHEGHHGGLAIGRATGIITGKFDEYPEQGRSKDSKPPKAKNSKPPKPKNSKPAKPKASKSAKKQTDIASAGKKKTGKKR